MNKTVFTKKTILERLTRSENKLKQLIASDECLLISSGEPLTKPGGLDQTYSFIPHPTYYWLSGSRRSGQTLLYSQKTGWRHFTQPVTTDEKIWEGTEEIQILTPDNQPVSDLSQFLKNENLKPVLGEREFTLRNAIDQIRRIKDEEEIALIEKVAKMALAGYSKMPGFIRPGISEREIQIAYETAVYQAGADFMPYETIVGAGNRSAILHAIPSERIVKENEIVLMDAGAALYDYCVDVTRVFASSKKLSSQQKDLYDLVLTAHQQSIQLCQSGVAWNKVHEKSARIIAEGLTHFGLLRCSTDSALESEAISLFFPHGVGHLVGLRVRDAGHEENQNPKRYFGARLRVDITLQKNMLITVEPGCYFISALLNQPDVQKRYKDLVDFSRLESWMEIGGVRIEDDILITDGMPRNLTEIIPKL